MSLPLLDQLIGLWLVSLVSDEEVQVTIVTTDGIVIVVKITKADIAAEYEDEVLAGVTVSPSKIDFIDKSFGELPPDQRPSTFVWKREHPSEADLRALKRRGTHPRRIEILHP